MQKPTHNFIDTTQKFETPNFSHYTFNTTILFSITRILHRNILGRSFIVVCLYYRKSFVLTKCIVLQNFHIYLQLS
jgi:hypothetical protein